MTGCKTGELCPPATLSRKWFAQRPSAYGRFRHHFHDALHATKFLGEKCGLMSPFEGESPRAGGFK